MITLKKKDPKVLQLPHKNCVVHKVKRSYNNRRFLQKLPLLRSLKYPVLPSNRTTRPISKHLHRNLILSAKNLKINSIKTLNIYNKFNRAYSYKNNYLNKMQLVN